MSFTSCYQQISLVSNNDITMDFKNIVVYLLRLISSYAYDDLSFQKVASQSSTWYGSIYNASYAVDRNTTTWARMLEMGRNSPYQTVWWKVDLGGVYSMYNVTILFKKYDRYEQRQRGRFAGFSLYVSNTDVSTISDIKNSNLCYKDGPQLPPLNFTITCTEHGRYVIFYNERLNEVTYPSNYEVDSVFTELLEVIVQGCNRTYTYGRNCDAPCPSNCEDNTCHIEYGTCFGCKPGWTGLYCTIKCSSGYFGLDCRERCSGHSINNERCDHVSGFCPRGCTDGYIGGHCNISCQPGFYGTNCSLPCPNNCKTCRQTDGLCSCKAGWMGHNCSIECSHTYGENCQYSCSGQCINRTCDRFNGNCFCDGKYDSLQNVGTTDVASSPYWIVAFLISLLINIVLISATLISRRKTVLKQKSKTDKVIFSCRSGSIKDQTVTTGYSSYYQDLRVSKNENTYQSLHNH